MAIVADVDVFIMGSGGAGLSCGARLRKFGLSVATADEVPSPGGMLIHLGLPDYVGVGPSTDTLSGVSRQFFIDCETAGIADGAVEGDVGWTWSEAEGLKPPADAPTQADQGGES